MKSLLKLVKDRKVKDGILRPELGGFQSGIQRPRAESILREIEVVRKTLLDFDRGVDPLNWSAVSTDEHS